jgi:hypothetical protein
MSIQSEFAAKVAELIAQTKDLAPAARSRVLEMLDATRREILGRLADVDPASFSAAQLTELKRSIDQAMDKFRSDATTFLESAESHAARMGAEGVTQPLIAIGMEAIAMGHVNPTTLSIAQGYTADLITNLSRQAAHDINSALQRAFLGGQSWDQIVQQIGRGLGATGRVSIFDKIGERAAGIATNEILRIHGISGQARMEELVERHPALKKIWKHIPVARFPRLTHLIADGQIKGVNEPFEIPVLPGAAPEELMYPRDPNGSAENTIFCHCLSLPHFDADVLKPSAEHKALLDKLGIAIKVA